MANPEHVAIVKQGAKAIAAWREKNPDIQLDLLDANLTGDNLSAANLNGANLVDANLNNANLIGASLKRTCLLGTNLIGVDHGADRCTLHAIGRSRAALPSERCCGVVRSSTR